MLQLFLHDERIASPAAPFLHLLIGKDGFAARAPVYGGAFLIREALLKELQEQPLVPFIVVRFTRRDFPAPVIGEAKTLQLIAHVRDVVARPHVRRDAFFNRGIFGRKPERIPTHGMQHGIAPHRFEASDDVADRVHPDVPHVNAPGGIRKHLKTVVLGA